MKKDREQAESLRRAGKSYSEIAEALKVPKSTLSTWFGRAMWSRQIEERLRAQSREARKIQILELNTLRLSNLARVYDDAREEAKREFDTLKYHPLFIAGLMLYWGEGERRTRQTVKLTNTDPEKVALFTFFLREICGIPEDTIHAQVLLYPGLIEAKCEEYWAKCSGVRPENFIKSSNIEGSRKPGRSGNGVCMVYVSSTYFKLKVTEWLKYLPGELMNKRYYENIEHEADIV